MNKEYISEATLREEIVELHRETIRIFKEEIRRRQIVIDKLEALLNNKDYVPTTTTDN